LLVDECARTLHLHGAGRVDVLVIARTMDVPRHSVDRAVCGEKNFDDQPQKQGNQRRNGALGNFKCRQTLG